MAGAEVYDKTVIELGIVGYYKVSLGKMISNTSAASLDINMPYSITV